MEGVSPCNKSLKERTRVNQIWANREEKYLYLQIRLECTIWDTVPEICPYRSKFRVCLEEALKTKLSTIYSPEQLYLIEGTKKCQETVCKARFLNNFSEKCRINSQKRRLFCVLKSTKKIENKTYCLEKLLIYLFVSGFVGRSVSTSLLHFYRFKSNYLLGFLCH